MLDSVCGVDRSRRERRPDELTSTQSAQLRALVLANIRDVLRGYGTSGEEQLRELPVLTTEEQAYVDRVQGDATRAI